MKNKGLIIALLILLTVIVFFLCMFLVYSLNGGKRFGLFNWRHESKNKIFDETYEIASIHDIQIKQNAGNISFKESQDDNVNVVIYGDSENDAVVNLSNSDLNIEVNKHNYIFNFGIKENNIVIYIPATFANKITIKSDYGNIEMADLPNATLVVDSDAGNVEIGRIRNLTAKCDYGNII